MPRSPKACRYARGVYTRGASGCGERTEFQIVIKKIDKDFLRLHHWDLLPVLCSQSTTGNERADVGFQIELVLAFVIVHRFDDFHFVRVAIRGETTRHDHILCAFLGTQDHNGALRRILVIPEPSAFGDVTRDLISKLRFAFAATAGQHRVLAARETREPNILDIFGLHFVRIDDVKLAVRLSACQPFPQLIEIVKDSAGNLSFLRVFIFSVPAQECSWVAPQYCGNVSSGDKSSPVEDDLANSWDRLRSSNPPLACRPLVFARRQASALRPMPAAGRPGRYSFHLPSLSASGRSGAAPCSASSKRRHLPGLCFSHCGRSLIPICKHRIDRVLPVAPLTGGGTLQNALQNADWPPKNRQ